ncbi:MAG TPA: amino acid adenylation domain-containing protein, partial [Thermoanaerobaculia bacterium]|nr:amino acid adenylation domain-containing protein [Thermoanaerobaculia bacterium]
GGHSLLATRVMSRLRGVFGIEMPLRDLFETPKLADLATRIEMMLRAGESSPAPPLSTVPRQGPLPLSFAQQRLWFIDQLEPGSPLYNIPAALRVEGPLDPEVLALCLGEIVRRHEALRTTFDAAQGVPEQLIQPAVPAVLSVVDLAGLPEHARETRALALAGEEADRPFDLARGPLLRSLLLRLTGSDHIFALTLHHIVSDGWSAGVLVREVAALYAAFTEGSPSPLPELPVQYADFAVWQRSWLQGEVLESELSFWRGQLAGLPPRLELPTDRPRPSVQSFRGTSQPVQLPAGLTRQAQTLGRREGATLFMVLLAGFQALLARYSNQERLAVGAPVAGRNRVEIEGLIGFFVNTLVLRGDLTGTPTFRELLARVRETTLAAHAHQDLPFERLVEELAPERSLAHAPLFQVMLALQNAPVGNLEIGELRLHPLSRTGTTAKFDLALSLEERGGALAGTAEHAADLFDPTTIRRLLAGFERLLAGALADPDRPVAELSLLSEAELHRVRSEWNPAGAAPDASLVETFESWVDRTPDAIAVLAPGEVLSYAELDRRANRLAHRLRALGVTIDSLVGLCAERSPAMIVAVLGILKAGAAYVPLDPAYPRERLAFMIDDARIPVLLTEQRLLGSLPETTAATVLLDSDGPVLERLWGTTTPDSLAYVIYTSGSTGRPKGAMIHHRGWSNLVDAQRRLFGFGPGDRVLQFASLGFDASAWEISMALGAGATLVLGPRERRLSTEELTALLRESTAAVLPPTVLSTLSPKDLPGLKTLIVGGEAWTVELAQAWAAGRRLWNAYGPTEASICATAMLYDGGERLPIGRPIARMQAHVLDAWGNPVPAGVAGELCLGGPGLARGYLDRPDRTAASFVPHPLAVLPGERLYRTGDLARWLPDGSLDFLGRLDHQVKVRGFRIELGEIEAALAALSGVSQAVVIVREDTPGVRHLVAYVMAEVEPKELREQLRERLPEHMVPGVFVRLNTLPLTPSGKVDRKALPAPDWQRFSDSYQAPRTPVEEVLAGIWGEVLGRERVGVADRFFDLGGHSLLATRVLSRVRETFGVELPLRELFEAPVLSEFAARIEAAGAGSAVSPLVPLVPVPREGLLPLSFAQERFWILDQLEPGNPTYNMPGEFELAGHLDVAALTAALGHVASRHEVLRTVFRVVEGTPHQHILPSIQIGLPVLDLAGLPEEVRHAEAKRLAAERSLHRFDLARGPLLDAALLRLDPDRHHLHMVLHHAICDGWSLPLLVREIGELYTACTAARPPALDRLRVQYADFAVWQRKLVSASRQAELAWWLDRLAGEIAPLEMPADRMRPAVQTYRGGRSSLVLPGGFAARLAAFGRAHGTTLFMTLLAAIKALLHRHSGQDDILVGAPVAGRRAVETEGLIGCFLNTLVLRTDVGGRPGFRELVARVREVTLGAYSHQDVPFEAVLASLPQQRDLSRTPLFQVMVNLLNLPSAELRLPGLVLESLAAAEPLSKFDMTFYIREGDGVRIELVYNADLFDAGRM